LTTASGAASCAGAVLAEALFAAGVLTAFELAAAVLALAGCGVVWLGAAVLPAEQPTHVRQTERNTRLATFI
jgi:hypothetical protein